MFKLFGIPRDSFLVEVADFLKSTSIKNPFFRLLFGPQPRRPQSEKSFLLHQAPLLKRRTNRMEFLVSSTLRSSSGPSISILKLESLVSKSSTPKQWSNWRARESQDTSLIIITERLDVIFSPRRSQNPSDKRKKISCLVVFIYKYSELRWCLSVKWWALEEVFSCVWWRRRPQRDEKIIQLHTNFCTNIHHHRPGLVMSYETWFWCFLFFIEHLPGLSLCLNNKHCANW